MAQITTIRTLAAAAVAVVVAGIATLPGQVAAAAELPIQAALRTAAGGAVADGNYLIFAALYDSADAKDPVWNVVIKQVPVHAGSLNVVLGVDGGKALADATIAGGKALWIGVAVGQDPELPRAPLRPAWHALYANEAGGLSCSGCVGSSAIAVAAIGAAHVDFTYAGSKEKGGAADLALVANEATHAATADTAKLADKAGHAATATQADNAMAAEEALFAASAKKLECTGCVQLAMLAPDVLSGVVAKTGDTMTGKLVAKAGVDLQGALLEGARLAAVDVKKTGCGADDLGRVAVGQGDAHPWYCDGKAWRRLASCSGLCPPATAVSCGVAIANDCGDDCGAKGLACPAGQSCSSDKCVAGLGSQANPAADCQAILLDQPGAQTGTFWLDPGGPGGKAAFEAWCEMTIEAGGWTLVAAQQNQIDGDPATPGLADVGTAKDGAAGTASYNTAFVGRPYTELLIVQAAPAGWLRYSGLDIAKFEAELKDTDGETSGGAGAQSDVWKAGTKVRGSLDGAPIQTLDPAAPVTVEIHHGGWNASASTNFILDVGAHPPGSGALNAWGFSSGGSILRVAGKEQTSTRSMLYVR